MARRRKSGSDKVSLFPFLSILACVIGCLTLMITALALGQMDNSDVKKIEEFENAKKSSEDEQKRIEELKKELEKAKSDAGEDQKSLSTKSAELQRLKNELEKAKNTKAKLQTVALVDKKQLDQRIADLQKELKELQDKIKPLQADLANRKKPPIPATVKVAPSGSGTTSGSVPTFVECAVSSVVVHDGPKPRRIVRQELSKDTRFLAMVDQIAEQAPKAKVIFLVREDGISTYYAARDIVRRRYATFGKLPVIGQGKIDLSLLTKK